MTKEEMMKIAKQAGISFISSGDFGVLDAAADDFSLIQFANLIIQRERDGFINFLDWAKYKQPSNDYQEGYNDACNELSDEIKGMK